MTDWRSETCSCCGAIFDTKLPYVRLCYSCNFDWWEGMARKLNPTLEPAIMIEWYAQVVTPLYGIT